MLMRRDHRLRVVDVNGRQTTSSVTVEFVGNLKLGQFRLSFADVRADAAGLPLMLTRTYDNTKKDVMGDFGWGWSASGQDITVRKNMQVGTAWAVETRNPERHRPLRQQSQLRRQRLQPQRHFERDQYGLHPLAQCLSSAPAVKLAGRLSHGRLEHRGEGTIACITAGCGDMAHGHATRQQGQGMRQDRLLPPLLVARAQLFAKQAGHGAFAGAHLGRPLG